MLAMLQHLVTSYREIYEINLKENEVKIMRPYDSKDTISCLIEKFEKGREFMCAEGQTISDEMMASKGITLLAQMVTFNKDIR